MEQLQMGTTMLEQLIVGFIVSAAFVYALKGVKAVINYLKSKESLIQDEKARKLFDNALNDVSNLITTNITSAEATLKPVIISDIKDGKVTKDELKSLATTVRDNVIKQLGDNLLDILNKNIGDLQGYVSNKLEEILAHLKEDPSSVVSYTVIPERTIDNSSDLKTLQDKCLELEADKVELLKANNDLETENTAIKTKLDEIIHPTTSGSENADNSVQG